MQERELEKEREEKKQQADEMERLKTWEKGREVRVDSWKGFKGDEKARPAVSSIISPVWHPHPQLDRGGRQPGPRMTWTPQLDGGGGGRLGPVWHLRPQLDAFVKGGPCEAIL